MQTEVTFSAGGADENTPDMSRVSEVRAHYPQPDGTTLVIVLTTEGMILDLVDDLGGVIATDSAMSDEICERLM